MAPGVFGAYVADLIGAAITGAEEKVAHDVVVIDMRALVDSFDALVIASGRTDRQVRAIAEEVERLITVTLGVKPIHVEGVMQAQWIALDYGDVIVHVFDEATREYYDLEHLWNAATTYRR